MPAFAETVDGARGAPAVPDNAQCDRKLSGCEPHHPIATAPAYHEARGLLATFHATAVLSAYHARNCQRSVMGGGM